MEVKKISVLEHDNKENIPPFLTLSKPAGPGDVKGKCTLLKINGRRKPLRDVTNFYRAAAQFKELNLSSPVLVSGFSSSRKRRLVDDAEKSCSKIMRKEYR